MLSPKVKSMRKIYPTTLCENCGKEYCINDIIRINRWNFIGKVCENCLKELTNSLPKHNYRICETEAGDYVVQKAKFYPNKGWEYETVVINGKTNFESIEKAKEALQDLKYPKK